MKVAHPILRDQRGLLAWGGPFLSAGDEPPSSARTCGHTLCHRVLGFYVGGFGQEIRIDREPRISPDGNNCDSLVTVSVHLSLTNRIIEVANDLESQGCRREVAWEHYRKHAAADDAVLSQYVQPVTVALQTAWPEMQDLLGQGSDNDMAALKTVIQSLLAKALQDYDQVRAEAFSAVDNPEEANNLVCRPRT
jgi:hypothetical protein